MEKVMSSTSKGYIWNNVENDWFYTDSVLSTVMQMFAGYYGLSPNTVKQSLYVHNDGEFKDYMFRNSIVRVRPMPSISNYAKNKRKIERLRNEIRETRDLLDGWVKVEKKG
jgi:hypothetical protein